MIIRKILENETEFLKEMLYEAIFVEKGKPKLPKSIIEEPILVNYIDDFGRNKYDICVVALVNKKLVGAAWGRLFDIENKGYGFVDLRTPELSIAIQQDYRNKGIGTKLIEKIIEQYKELNVKSISLSVDKNNLAFKLYAKIGFEIVAETEKSVTMKKEI